MKNLKKIPFILSILSFLTIFTPANADLRVVTSIKPIHSLASYLMDGVGKPDLIVDGYSSPHGFALKPSHAKMLQDADIIFYVGEGLENFLEKPLKSIAKKAEKIELMEIKGLKKLKFRERNIFDDHDDEHKHEEDGHKEDDHDDEHKHEEDGHKEDDHDDEHKHEEDGHKEDDHDDEHKHEEDGHKEDDHDDEHKHEEDGHKEDDHDDEHKHEEDGHKEDDHDDEHKHEEDGHDDHGHDEDGHDSHAHGEYDPHIWLDPENAKAILNEMVEHLIENDEKNSAIYKSNLNKALNDIDKLSKSVKSELNKDFKSIVFHDGYQYFEERFGVTVLGAFTVNTDVMPGAEQLSEIREIIEHDKVSCIFSEPQFNPNIINAVAKDMNIKTGVLDPLGATLEPGKDLYFDLIKNMSKSFKGC